VAFSFVQDDGSALGSGSAHSVVMGANVTANNLLVVGASWTSTDTTCTLSDTRSSTWVDLISAGHPNVGGRFIAAFYAVVPSTGADTVTMTLGASRTDLQMIVTEYAGGLTTSAVLGKVTAIANNTSNPTVGPLEVVTTGELGWGFESNFNGEAVSATGGWLERIELTNLAQTQDFISPSLGNLTCQWTSAGADDFARVMVLFRSQAPVAAPQYIDAGYVGTSGRPRLTRYRRY
jgi:hypothetical protein